MLALLCQRERGHRQLQRSRHPIHVRFRDFVLLQRPKGAAQQALGDVFVVARDNDRNVEVGTAQIRLLAFLTQSSKRLQQVTQLVFLCLQVALVVGVGGDIDRHPLNHFEPEPLEAVDLLGVVGKQPDLAHA